MTNAMIFGAAKQTAKVADPTTAPAAGYYNVFPAHTKTIGISDTNPSAHIFYTKDGSSPTHSGDTPTGTTFRIGSNSGTIVLLGGSGGIGTDIIALAYVSGLTDSNIVTKSYIIDDGT